MESPTWTSVIIACTVLLALGRQRRVTETAWLCLNLLDTFRSLRLSRSNGRRVGTQTRRKMMRETLTCWVVFVGVNVMSATLDPILGWVPLYSTIKTVMSACFLFTRVASSLAIYETLLTPLLSSYETPIDLTLLLVHSLALLAFHYSLRLPYLKAYGLLVDRPRSLVARIVAGLSVGAPWFNTRSSHLNIQSGPTSHPPLQLLQVRQVSCSPPSAHLASPAGSPLVRGPVVETGGSTPLTSRTRHTPSHGQSQATRSPSTSVHPRSAFSASIPHPGVPNVSSVLLFTGERSRSAATVRARERLAPSLRAQPSSNIELPVPPVAGSGMTVPHDKRELPKEKEKNRPLGSNNPAANANRPGQFSAPVQRRHVDERRLHRENQENSSAPARLAIAASSSASKADREKNSGRDRAQTSALLAQARLNTGAGAAPVARVSRSRPATAANAAAASASPSQGGIGPIRASSSVAGRQAQIEAAGRPYPKLEKQIPLVRRHPAPSEPMSRRGMHSSSTIKPRGARPAVLKDEVIGVSSAPARLSREAEVPRSKAKAVKGTGGVPPPPRLLASHSLHGQPNGTTDQSTSPSLKRKRSELEPEPGQARDESREAIELRA